MSGRQTKTIYRPSPPDAETEARNEEVKYTRCKDKDRRLMHFACTALHLSPFTVVRKPHRVAPTISNASSSSSSSSSSVRPDSQSLQTMLVQQLVHSSVVWVGQFISHGSFGCAFHCCMQSTYNSLDEDNLQLVIKLPITLVKPAYLRPTTTNDGKWRHLNEIMQSSENI